MTEKLHKIDPRQLAAERRTFDKLEPAIHSKARLAIVSLLAANPALTFTELRDSLELTDGNLAAHLRALDAAGFIQQRRVNSRPKPTTSFALSAAGRRAFVRYLEGLEALVKRHR
jgi:DNA-binding HxlR family transcriptional regulator